MKAKKAARNRRRSQLETNPRLPDLAKTFRDLSEQLSDEMGVLSAMMYAQELDPDDPDEDGKVVELLKFRYRRDLLMKAQGCRLYFRRLAERAEANAARARAASGMNPVNSDDEELLESDEEEEREEGQYQSTAHMIADAVADDLGAQYCGRTLRGWASEFRRRGTFSLDGRGNHRGEHLHPEGAGIHAGVRA